MQRHPHESCKAARWRKAAQHQQWLSGMTGTCVGSRAARELTRGSGGKRLPQPHLSLRLVQLEIAAKARILQPRGTQCLSTAETAASG